MADNPTAPPWLLEQDYKTSRALARSIPYVGALGVRNRHQVFAAEIELRREVDCWSADDVPVPDRFPRLLLAFPDNDFAPDYVEWEGYMFSSERLRQVLNQPEDVVQFVPINLVAGNDAARAQKYSWMRVLAEQPVIDIAASDVTMELAPLTIKQQSRFYIKSANQKRFVLRYDFAGKTEIFRVYDTRIYTMTSDDLAHRILRSGCTGVAFRDPTSPFDEWDVAASVRYLTAKGIIKRRY